MARILIVGGGCRGRRLADVLAARGQAVRVTTRTEAGRSAIEATGSECFIGTPDRLATLGAALENVAVACWLLGTASGAPAQVRALHGARLQAFVALTVDTTVRGFVYESAGSSGERGALLHGREIVHALAERNAIPTAFLTTDPREVPGWLAEAGAAIDSLLAGP